MAKVFKWQKCLNGRFSPQKIYLSYELKLFFYMNYLTPKYLFLSKEYLMQKSADQIDNIQYPDKLKVNNIPVTLKYHFEPNHPNDGLTVAFSYSALSQIKKECLLLLVV